MSTAPGPLSPTATSTVSAPRGPLYAETFSPAATARGVVVITHGYAEHCGRYREVANVIVSAGWSVLTYDVRGHGRSTGQRGYIERFEIYLQDLAAACAAGRALAPAGAPLVLLGHSAGGLITLRALASGAPATAAIISSPFLGLRLPVPGYKKVMAKVASRLLPTLSMPNDLKVEDLTADLQKQAERTADKQCFDVATARWFTEALAAQAYVADHVAAITVPTLWLVGGDDPIANPARAREIATAVTGATYHDLVGMRHEVLNEVERGRVFDLIRDRLGELTR
jgi:alpha-beta hydrolase superfamily lysophospholipase